MPDDLMVNGYSGLSWVVVHSAAPAGERGRSAFDHAATTKKFPSAMTAEGYASSRSNFVIPSLDGELRFVDIRNGKSYETAYLVYVGRPITTADVLQKLSFAPSDLERAPLFVDSLIEELARF